MFQPHKPHGFLRLVPFDPWAPGVVRKKIIVDGVKQFGARSHDAQVVAVLLIGERSVRGKVADHAVKIFPKKIVWESVVGKLVADSLKYGGLRKLLPVG